MHYGKLFMTLVNNFCLTKNNKVKFQLGLEI